MTRPGNGPYKEYCDDQYHVHIRIPPRVHDQIVKSMVRRGLNRTEWVRDAILEKLAEERVVG